MLGTTGKRAGIVWTNDRKGNKKSEKNSNKRKAEEVSPTTKEQDDRAALQDPLKTLLEGVTDFLSQDTELTSAVQIKSDPGGVGSHSVKNPTSSYPGGVVAGVTSALSIVNKVRGGG